MQRDVCRLVKKRPPKMVVSFQPQRHLNDAMVGIEQRQGKTAGDHAEMRDAVALTDDHRAEPRSWTVRG